MSLIHKKSFKTHFVPLIGSELCLQCEHVTKLYISSLLSLDIFYFNIYSLFVYVGSSQGLQADRCRTCISVLIMDERVPLRHPLCHLLRFFFKIAVSFSALMCTEK